MLVVDDRLTVTTTTGYLNIIPTLGVFVVDDRPIVTTTTGCCRAGGPVMTIMGYV